MPTPDFNFPIEDYNITPAFPVLVSQSEDSTEQRRLITDKEIWAYSLTSPFMTKVDAYSWWQFYQSKKGMLTGFSFKCPLRDIIINVRFDDEMQINHSRGTYRIRCKLMQLANSEVV